MSLRVRHRPRPAAGLLVAAALATALAASPAAGREWRVAPGTALATPQAALAVAADGDVVRVAAGTYRGALRVERAIRLVGEGAPVLDGGGAGTVVTLAAAGATLEGFRVRGSGSSLEREDAGVRVDAPGARVADNELTDVLFGISVQEAPGSVVLRNRIAGKPLDVARRGDAIRVFESDDTRVAGNVVTDSRDVVLWYSERLTAHGNSVQRSRYGLHFMFCDDADIRGNVLAGNSVGAFLMYSRRLRFTGNAVAGNSGPSGYGLGLKDMDAFLVRGNRFTGNRVGIFLDSSPQDPRRGADIAGNLLATGEVGMRLMPSVSGLRVQDNSFVENGQQVEIAGGGGDPAANRWHRNHWSDYLGYDAGGDGIGDVPYRAERLFEQLTDRRPELRLFALAPASRAIDFAARAFPIVRPQPKLHDDAPRLAPVLPAGVPALPAAAGDRSPRWLPGSFFLVSLALIAGTRRLATARRRPVVTPAPFERIQTMNDTPLLEVRDLGKRFGSRVALAGVGFTMRAGEAVALWGPNGAGKTTLLRALLGVMPFDGAVRVAGLDVRANGRAARRLVGFVPQEISFPEMTAGEALRLVARLHGAPEERLPAVVQRLGLAGELDKRVQELSGGRKQRLALAAALASDPPLLLLDEPSASLDAAARRELIATLATLKAEGKTLLLSSHRPEEIARLADRVLHLEEGIVVADLPPIALLQAELAPLADPRLLAIPAGGGGDRTGDLARLPGFLNAIHAGAGLALEVHHDNGNGHPS